MKRREELENRQKIFTVRKILIKLEKLKMKSSLALLTILNWRWKLGGGGRGGGKKEILLRLK